ncbi:MAG: ATP-binding cassette domain-containing protein [bacterium]|nr:ATP-binding cassette domain-containing protein [bacterium]
MISFQQVAVRYPLGNVALEDATFEIEDNEFVYLVGPSGAGKTTILKLILHELVPTEGVITIDDFQFSHKNFKRVAELRQKIGVVFQDFKILPDDSVFENIAISMEIKGYPTKEIRKQVEEALALTGISDKKTLFPAQLSAGELQRVAISRAIVGNRKIILADEPTGNLDPKTAWDIMNIFKKLAISKTILFATHNTDIVNSLRRRVLVLKDGRIIKDNKKGGYKL